MPSSDFLTNAFFAWVGVAVTIFIASFICFVIWCALLDINPKNEAAS